MFFAFGLLGLLAWQLCLKEREHKRSGDSSCVDEVEPAWSESWELSWSAVVALSDAGGGVNISAEFSTGVESLATATMLVLFSLVGPALASPLRVFSTLSGWMILGHWARKWPNSLQWKHFFCPLWGQPLPRWVAELQCGQLGILPA